MRIRKANNNQKLESVKGDDEHILQPCCFSRSNNWLQKLHASSGLEINQVATMEDVVTRFASTSGSSSVSPSCDENIGSDPNIISSSTSCGEKILPGISSSSSNSSRCSEVYLFGLPFSDFEQVPPEGSVAQNVNKRKRKQDRPKLWKQEAPLQEEMHGFLRLQYQDCRVEGISLDGSEEMQHKRKLRDADLAFKVPRRTRLQSSTAGLLNGGNRNHPDHPACQPEDTLAFSVYKVFSKAGKNGLTPREAVSKILDQGLPGLGECSVVPRVEVEGIVRTSPYFMELEDSKFVLCSAITAAEEKLKQQEQQKQQQQQMTILDDDDEDEAGHLHVHKLAAFAVRKARTGKTRRKQNFTVPVVVEEIRTRTMTGCVATRRSRETKNVVPTTSSTKKPVQSRKRRLKTVQQDGTNLGERCNRSDGKGWHCPLRAQVGYLLCDHHLDRLRAKTGSKPRRPGGLSGKNNANNSNNNSNNNNNNNNSNPNKNVRTGNRGRRKRKTGNDTDEIPNIPPPVAKNEGKDNTWALRRSLARLSVRISDEMDEVDGGKVRASGKNRRTSP